MKIIIEKVSALDRKKGILENLIKDLDIKKFKKRCWRPVLRGDRNKLGYDAVKVNKFETMKTTLENYICRSITKRIRFFLSEEDKLEEKKKQSIILDII